MKSPKKHNENTVFLEDLKEDFETAKKLLNSEKRKKKQGAAKSNKKPEQLLDVMSVNCRNNITSAKSGMMVVSELGNSQQ